MDYIKLVDETTIDIEDGGMINDLTHIAMTEPTARSVVEALRPENVTHIEFYSRENSEPYGVYDNMILAFTPTRAVEENGIIVKFGFRAMTDVEKRVTELENSQTDIEVALAEVYELIV